VSRCGVLYLAGSGKGLMSRVLLLDLGETLIHEM